MIPIPKGSAPTILDQLAALDSCAEIWQAMTPRQQQIATLRLVGLSNRQIGELLGTTRENIGLTLKCAQQRIGRRHPELRPLLGRYLYTRGPKAKSPHHRQLDWSWIEEQDTILSPSKDSILSLSKEENEQCDSI